MKTLLLFLIFQLGPDGKPADVRTAQQVFDTEDECFAAGQAIQGEMPKDVLSIATCVPQKAFDKKPETQQGEQP